VKVIILAAGRGSRMGEQTLDKPKGLSVVNGRSLLDMALNACSSIVDKQDIIVIGGYRHEMLKALHPNVMVNPEWESTNIMGSLIVADPVLRAEDCVVIYSDVIFEARDLSLISKSKGPSVLSVCNWESVWQRRFSEPLDDLEKFDYDPESGFLREIGGRPSSLEEIHGQFSGIWKSTPQLWSTLTCKVSNLADLDTTTALRTCVMNGENIQVVFGTGNWFEFDHPSDLEAFSRGQS
jgi:choline kinase